MKTYRERVLEIYMEPRFGTREIMLDNLALLCEQVADEARREENEACAKIANLNKGGRYADKAIRARIKEKK